MNALPPTDKLPVKHFRVETPDFIFYADSKDILSLVDFIANKYGEHFCSTIIKISLI